MPLRPRFWRPWLVSVSCLVPVNLSAADDAGDVRPHAGMLRYPDVGPTHIVFLYANDLWLAPRAGGLATPLAGPPGEELFPRFSPDGGTIAFVGNYDGARDLYTIPAEGGVPRRVTHHPDGETLCDWTPDGQRLVFMTRGFGMSRVIQLFEVAAGGGLPRQLPVPYGAAAAISPDGQWLAYTPHTRDARTWKRYRGGMATDIWLFHLTRHESRKITSWEGTDTLPMWRGKKVYYLSDAGANHRLNIWSYDTESGQTQQITDFSDFDVKWPSIGPGDNGRGEIVFQNGAELRLLDLASGQSKTVEVTIPGARPLLRPQAADVSELIFNWGVSPTGKRAVIEARGDIWTVPAEHGTARNLTRSSGAAERDPSWSPDGRWIAYFSDQSGEYELYVAQSDGQGETKQLTRDGQKFRYSPTWSPDSKRIVFTDKTSAMFLHTIESGETKLIDTEPWADQMRADFSPDGRWIAYTKGCDNRLQAIWLYKIETGARSQLTAGMFNDTWPTFDREGKYLYFASNREISAPIYEELGTTFVYANTDRLYVTPLRKDIASPLAPKSDEETWGDEGKEAENEDEKSSDDAGDEEDKAEGEGDREDEDKDEDDDEKAEKPKLIDPFEIDVEGFERRAVEIPVERGNFFNLGVNDKGRLLYTRGAPRGGDGKPAIKLFDVGEKKDKERKEQTVLEDAASFALTADGKKLLVRKDGKFALLEAKKEQKFEDPLSLAELRAWTEPRAEWRQIFHDAWRVQRDFFYDPTMHGVDWAAVREHYAGMLADCVSRADVSYVIREMISELNVGHAYYWGGDAEGEPRLSVGLLGCDYALENGAYRIRRIYEGAPWDVDARGPLSQPGVDAHEGDYLLAVNGAPVDAGKDPWAAFVGLAERVVTLTLSSKPSLDEEARRIVVKTLGSESDLRYRAWIEKNRALVAEKTGGQVGYVYVPNTGIDGQNNLFRQFHGQIDKAALIIDERWNGGGQIPTRFIELLNRPATNYWAVRDGRDWTWPPDSHQGPKCMLINGLAGSGGDCFPYYFRQAGLGKLIGTRTWGGLVGISGNPALVDGGYTSAPTFAFYEQDGTWGVEGHGVDPDIVVIDDPALMVGGGDPQLDAAIDLMARQVRESGYAPPSRPKYPDRRGMGIREEDK